MAEGHGQQGQREEDWRYLRSLGHSLSGLIAQRQGRSLRWEIVSVWSTAERAGGGSSQQIEAIRWADQLRRAGAMLNNKQENSFNYRRGDRFGHSSEHTRRGSSACI